MLELVKITKERFPEIKSDDEFNNEYEGLLDKICTKGLKKPQYFMDKFKEDRINVLTLTTRREMLSYLMKEEIPVYKNLQVHEYMDKQINKRKENIFRSVHRFFNWFNEEETPMVMIGSFGAFVTGIGWGLAATGKEQSPTIAHICMPLFFVCLGILGWYFNSILMTKLFNRRIYRTWQWVNIEQAQQPIPIEILRRAAKIKEDLGEEVGFRVTQVLNKKEHRTIYTPEFRLDPFIAVYNVKAPNDYYIFDRWDEPGFNLVKK